MRNWTCLIAAGSIGFTAATAARAAEPSALQAPLNSGQQEIVSYPAGFFRQYEPDTALDMVLQLPGFQIDDGSAERGFGGAAGNILINDRRPSAKQDLPSEILRRVPARLVERIDLIRGQIRGLDIQGHAVLANVVLLEDAPAAVRWDASLRKHSNVVPLRGETSISVSDQWRAIDYTAGVSGFRATFGDLGTKDVFAGDGRLAEKRFDGSNVVNVTTAAHLSASTWLGETLLNMNSSLGYTNRDELLASHRIPQDAGSASRDEWFGDDVTTRDFEIGVDAERDLGRELRGKAILLLYGSDQDTRNDQRAIEEDGRQTLFRLADSQRDTTEAIARLEFDWTGWAGHAVQANFEGAYNLLDNALVQTDDTGQGPVTIDVPGANARVEEVRVDVLLQDTWSLDAWTLNYGLGAEASTLSQSGDANQEESFFFLKPRVFLTWSPAPDRQTRFGIVREVAQLDFSDFVSATVFLDDDLALGNPDLKPESTWVSELTHERRMGDLAVVSATLFHHWISDVQDLLPLTPEFEAPGNIGDGRRYGLELQSTIPMEWLRLPEARVDVMARWQDSVVTDPVTGEERVLTAPGGFSGVPTTLPLHDDNEYAWAVKFRQDLQAEQVAWGWSVSKRAERPRFKVNELDIYAEESPVVDVFIETTRWHDIKVGFMINNLLDMTALRDRTIYTGQRGLSGVERREVQQYSLGRRYILSLSGSF